MVSDEVKRTVRKKKGKVVRLSDTIEQFIRRKRRKSDESYDAVLRRLFGIDTLKGAKQPLRTYFILETDRDPIAKRTLAEARGEAIILAVRRQKKRIYKGETPIKVQEVP